MPRQGNESQPRFRSQRKRVFRLDVSNPTDSLSVIEALLGELACSNLIFERSGYISVEHCGNVNVFCLELSFHSVSLSEALQAELTGRDWTGVSRMSLVLYSNNNAASFLQLFPSVSQLPPSARSSRLLGLCKDISVSTEDSIRGILNKGFAEAGCGIESVILDGIQALLINRRLDIVNDIARHLLFMKRKCPDSHVSNWVDRMVLRIQSAFQWANQGATLVIS
jgi:hypothetical protein